MVSGDPYLGADPRLAWMLRVLSDEFGMLGVLRTQQAAFDYVDSGGAVDHRMRPWDEEDASPEPSIPRREAREAGCRAVLNLRGQDYPCDMECVDADGRPTQGHEGWAHSNQAARAVWIGHDERESVERWQDQMQEGDE